MLRQSKLSENMLLTPLLVLVGLFVSSSAVSSRENPRRQFEGFGESGSTHVGGIIETDGRSVEKDFQKGEEIGESDFEDDYSEDLINSFGANELSVQSVTHLHEEKGEILVPCFGMWWPVGGATYDDGGDDGGGNGDGGDGGGKKKKKRRSRKQKKAAKMKKKKS